MLPSLDWGGIRVLPSGLTTGAGTDPCARCAGSRWWTIGRGGNGCGFRIDPPCARGFNGRAGDAVSVQMVPEVSELSPVASGPDSFSRPSQEHGDLSDVEWSRTVLEHLWNTNFVERWGPLVIVRRSRC